MIKEEDFERIRKHAEGLIETGDYVDVNQLIAVAKSEFSITTTVRELDASARASVFGASMEDYMSRKIVEIRRRQHNEECGKSRNPAPRDSSLNVSFKSTEYFPPRSI